MYPLVSGYKLLVRDTCIRLHVSGVNAVNAKDIRYLVVSRFLRHNANDGATKSVTTQQTTLYHVHAVNIKQPVHVTV